VTVGSGRRPRLSPAYPLLMSPCVGTGALTPGPLSPTPRATPPGRLPTRGGPATAPQEGGRADAILGPRPPVGPPGTVSGPAPDTRQHPWLPRPCPPYNDGAYPLAPVGGRPHDPGPPSLARTGAAPGPHTGEPGG